MLSLFTACVFFSRYRTDSQTRQTIRQSIDRHTDRQLDSRQTDRQSDSRQQTETNGLVWVSDWGRVFFFSPNHCEFLISVITHDYTCNERKLGGRFPQCFLLFFFSLLPVCLSLHHLLLLSIPGNMYAFLLGSLQRDAASFGFIHFFLSWGKITATFWLV